MVSARNARELIDMVADLAEVGRNVQETLAQVTRRQEEFAGELKSQRERLENACNEITGEISSQLYAFDQMRSLYEE